VLVPAGHGLLLRIGSDAKQKLVEESAAGVFGLRMGVMRPGLARTPVL
jgi:hypothetical protein